MLARVTLLPPPSIASPSIHASFPPFPASLFVLLSSLSRLFVCASCAFPTLHFFGSASLLLARPLPLLPRPTRALPLTGAKLAITAKFRTLGHVDGNLCTKFDSAQIARL